MKKIYLEVFHNHLNSIDDSIQFTKEIEYDSNIPFLDVLVYKKDNGEMGHEVYRRKTHMDLYLHASSHHHYAQKMRVLNTLITRAFRISDNDHKHKEKMHLTKALMRNGFFH